MRVSEYLREEIREDIDGFRSDPLWWATLRAMLEGWFALALLFRQTVHNLVYGTVADDPQRDTTLRYTP